MICDERGCSLAGEPVWAIYPDVTSELAGETATATLSLPLHRCADGHLSGWRPGDDYLGDLALELRELDDRVLGADGVPPRRRLFRGRSCGNCAASLELRGTGRRSTGEVRAWVGTSPDPIRFDVDLPELACAACGAAPSWHGAAAEGLPTDLLGWMLAWIAAAMPPDRAAEVRPRTPGRS